MSVTNDRKSTNARLRLSLMHRLLIGFWNADTDCTGLSRLNYWRNPACVCRERSSYDILINFFFKQMHRQTVNSQMYNNNLLHLYSAFLGTQISSTTTNVQHPPGCDGSHIGHIYQTAHHTPAYWWRGDSDDWWSQSVYVWGWLGGHDVQRPMGKFDQDAGVTSAFLITTERQGLGLMHFLLASLTPLPAAT